MKKENLILVAIIAAACLGIAALLPAQTVPQSPTPARHAQQELAVGLLRSTNTAEASYKMQHGSYVAWTVLLVNESKYFGRAFLVVAANYGFAQTPPPDHRLAEMRLAVGPEILPGWNLRLNVHADGQGYDLLLEDLTDKQCGYAALTDESGIIRQSRTIDCEL